MQLQGRICVVLGVSETVFVARTIIALLDVHFTEQIVAEDFWRLDGFMVPTGLVFDEEKRATG